MRDACVATLSVLLGIALSIKESTALPPVPAPSVAFEYLQLQILVIGSGDLVELSSLTSGCLADYAPQSVTASPGCTSSGDKSTGSNTTKSATEVAGNCQTVTLVLAAHGNAVNSVSFQDTLLVDLVDCYEIQNDGWKVQALKDAQGISHATIPLSSANSSVVELPSPGPATGPLPEAPAALINPSSAPGVLVEAPGPAAAQNTAFLEYLGPWQQCSASCGTGVQERSLLCYGNEGYMLDELPSCDAQTTTTWRTCSDATCGSTQWTYGSWGACSSTCGGGTTKRTVQCTSSERLLGKQSSACTEAPPVALERECNVQPCEFFTWAIGAWSSCSQSCGGGTMTRDVNCTSVDGFAVATELCEQPAPSAMMLCNQTPCDFCSGNTCNTQGQCVLGFCDCFDSFFGAYCEIPIDCASGVTDNYGACCPSGVIDSQAKCCPGGSIVNGTGACCAAGKVDACGVCGGNATIVDVTGVCCQGVLDAAGLCCTGYVDECGVCGGVGSSCALTLEYNAALVLLDTAQTTLKVLDDFSTQLEAVVAGKLGVADSTISTTNTQPLRTSATGLSAVITAFITPPSATDPGEDFTAAAAQRELATMNGSLWISSTFAVGNAAVDGIWRAGQCGNAICEIGEREGSGGNACPEDCPLSYVACPLVNGSFCGGKGRCFSGSGACDCFAGYAGDACNLCAFGWTQSADGACFPYAPDILLLTPQLGYHPPPPSPPPRPPPLPPSPPPPSQPPPSPPPPVISQASASSAPAGPQLPTLAIATSPPFDPTFQNLQQPPPRPNSPAAAPAPRDANGELLGHFLAQAAPSLPDGVSSWAKANAGATAGIVVGIVVLLAAAALLVVWAVKHRRFKRRARSLADAWQSGSERPSDDGSGGGDSHRSSDSGGVQDVAQLGLRQAFTPQKGSKGGGGGDGDVELGDLPSSVPARQLESSPVLRSRRAHPLSESEKSWQEVMRSSYASASSLAPSSRFSPSHAAYELPRRPDRRAFFVREEEGDGSELPAAAKPGAIGPLTHDWRVVNSPIFSVDSPGSDQASPLPVRLDDPEANLPPRGPTRQPPSALPRDKENSLSSGRSLKGGQAVSSQAAMQPEATPPGGLRQPLGSSSTNIPSWDSVSRAHAAGEKSRMYKTSGMSHLTPTSKQVAETMLRTPAEAELQYLSTDGPPLSSGKLAKGFESAVDSSIDCSTSSLEDDSSEGSYLEAAQAAQRYAQTSSAGDASLVRHKTSKFSLFQAGYTAEALADETG